MFSLCNPTKVKQQIILPVTSNKYKAADGIDIDSSFPFTESSRQRDTLKIKLPLPDSPRTKQKRLEEEIFLFTLDVHVTHAALHEFERELLLNGSCGGTIYQCEHSGLQVSSELVQILRRTVQKRAQAPATPSFKNTEVSGAAFKTLVDLLKNYHEYPRGTHHSTPYHGNCFTSIKHALVIVDILLASCCEMFYVGGPQRIVPLLLDFRDLLLACIELVGYVSTDNSNIIALPFGQIMLKYTSMLKFYSNALGSMSGEDMKVKVNSASILIGLIQTVANGLSIMRSMCGEETLLRYVATLKFWDACEAFIQAMSSNYLDRQESSMSNLLINKILHSYLSSLPSAPEILFELKRLETLELSSVGFTDDYHLSILLLDTLDTLQMRTPDKNDEVVTAAGPNSLSSIQHLESNGSYAVFDKRTHLLFTLHSRFLWIGMLRMMHMPYFQQQGDIAQAMSSPRIIFPEREKWFSSLYELLTFILKEKITSVDSRHLLPLAPFIAHTMLKISMSLEHDASIDWIYWSLVKLLSKFNERLRNATRLFQTSTSIDRSSKSQNHSTRSNAHSVSSASLRSHDSEKSSHVRSALSMNQLPSSGNTFSKSVDISLETPFKELNKDRENLKATFQIGDEIDALYPLPNGTKRWFPGKISGRNEDLTFSILFDDGDIVPKQSASDIRYTKKHRPGPRPIASNAPTLASIESEKDIDILSPVPIRSESPPINLLHASSDLSLHNLPHVEFEEEEEGQVSEADSEEDRVFEIPSVLDGHYRKNNGSNKDEHEGIVPRMQFANLPLSSSLPHAASTASLSGSLLREADNSPRNEDSQSLSTTMNHSLSMSMQSRPQYGHSTPFIHSHRSTHRSANNNVVVSNEIEDSLESSMSSLGTYSIKPIHSARSALTRHNLAIGNFSEVLREEGSITGNTRMLSWRGEESARGFTGRTSARSNLHKPSNPPAESLQHSAREVVGNPGSSKYSNSKKSDPTSALSSGKDESHTLDSKILLHENVYPYLSQAYALIAVIILKRCFLDKDILDYACCVSHDPTSRVPTLSEQRGEVSPLPSLESTIKEQSINLLYNVREYLELCNAQEIRYCFPIVASSSANANGLLRLCKLLHNCFFDNCLKDHMNTHCNKIGEGGFGTVFKVVCPEECSLYKSFSHCYGCYKKTKGKSSSPRHKKSRKFSGDLSSHLPSPFVNLLPSAGSVCHGHADHFECQRAFAVKRIARERSLHDQSTIFSLYQEITSLEKLQHLIGVCGIEDYGVVGGEYWLVMEHGWSTLTDWRGSVSPFRACNPSPKKESTNSPDSGATIKAAEGVRLSRKEIALFVMMYLDILYIIRDIHKGDVAHFDLKGSNFLLREDPVNAKQHIWRCLQYNKASGVIFLADFGEAIPHISSVSDDSLRKRSRGTLSVQSPEMLCISESSSEMESSIAVERGNLSDLSNMSLPKRSNARRSFKISVFKDSHITSQSSLNSSSPTPFVSPGHMQERSSAKSKAHSFPVPNAASDVWSLGCLLIEMLTGNMLFQDRSWPELYTKLCLSEGHSAWAQDLECLSCALHVLDGEVKVKITDIVLEAMQKDASKRATVNQLIIMTKALLDMHFSKDILSEGEKEEGIPFSYSNSGDSMDDSRRNSFELNPLDKEPSWKLVDAAETEEDHGQLVDIVKSLGMVSSEVFSVFQFQPYVWVGCETAVYSVLAPLLEKYAEQLGNEAVLHEKLASIDSRLTCQTLINHKPSLSSSHANAHSFQPCLQVDEFIASCCGAHAISSDFLSDMLWQSYYEAYRAGNRTSPSIIWIKVSKAKERRKSMFEKIFKGFSQKQDRINCLEVLRVAFQHTEGTDNISSIKSLVKDVYEEAVGQCLASDNPPIVLISVEDTAGLPTSDEPDDKPAFSYRHIDKTTFSVALGIAGMIAATVNTSLTNDHDKTAGGEKSGNIKVENSMSTPLGNKSSSHSYLSWAPKEEKLKYDEMEVLRLVGKMQRTMPWMDNLLDVYLVQDLIA